MVVTPEVVSDLVGTWVVNGDDLRAASTPRCSRGNKYGIIASDG
jgi:hypothetical protein